MPSGPPPAGAAQEPATDIARCPSSSHRADFVHIGRLVMPVDRNNQGQSDSRFGRGDSNRKDHKHHSRQCFGMRTKPPKGDEVQIRGIQHQLDANQYHDRVTSRQCARQPDRKQHRRENQIARKRCHLPSFSFMAIKTAPISAAVNNNPITSSGKTYCPIILSPMPLTVACGSAGMPVFAIRLLQIIAASTANTATAVAAPTIHDPEKTDSPLGSPLRVSRMAKTIRIATAPTYTRTWANPTNCAESCK